MKRYYESSKVLYIDTTNCGFIFRTKTCPEGQVFSGNPMDDPHKWAPILMPEDGPEPRILDWLAEYYNDWELLKKYNDQVARESISESQAAIRRGFWIFRR